MISHTYKNGKVTKSKSETLDNIKFWDYLYVYGKGLGIDTFSWEVRHKSSEATYYFEDDDETKLPIGCVFLWEEKFYFFF